MTIELVKRFSHQNYTPLPFPPFNTNYQLHRKNYIEKEEPPLRERSLLKLLDYLLLVKVAYVVSLLKLLLSVQKLVRECRHTIARESLHSMYVSKYSWRFVRLSDIVYICHIHLQLYISLIKIQLMIDVVS